MQSLKRVGSTVAAGLIAVSCIGCGDHADALIVIHLKVLVLSTDDQPVRFATIWLRDRRFPEHSQPHFLRKAVCVTNEHGKCAVEIRYRYGYTSWPWLRRFQSKLPLSDRFELGVFQDGQLFARRALTPLAAPQIQGAADVDVSIRLDARPTEPW